jgi:hypothetical protein
MRQSSLSSVAVVSFCLGALGHAPAAGADDPPPALRLRAFAVDLGSSRTPTRTGTLDIVIERWSTPEELRTLRSAVIEKGEEGLLSALQDLKRVGYIRGSTSIGWDIHFAHQQPVSDGGRRVVIATDRPMSFWEAANRPRSADYQFTLAEIRIRADGKGEGKLVPAAKVDYDEETNTLEIENYALEPVRLTEVRVEK